MQTSRLWLQDLRAISSGQCPGRWPTPSPRVAAIWKSAPPLPNHLGPTWAVGWPAAARLPIRDLAPAWGAGLDQLRGRQMVQRPWPAVGPARHQACGGQAASLLCAQPSGGRRTGARSARGALPCMGGGAVGRASPERAAPAGAHDPCSATRCAGFWASLRAASRPQRSLRRGGAWRATTSR